MALRTAEKLLHELKPRPDDLRAILLQNMAQVATKNKANVETAIQNFMEIAAAEVHNGATFFLYFTIIH